MKNVGVVSETISSGTSMRISAEMLEDFPNKYPVGLSGTKDEIYGGTFGGIPRGIFVGFMWGILRRPSGIFEEIPG